MFKVHFVTRHSETIHKGFGSSIFCTFLWDCLFCGRIV